MITDLVSGAVVLSLVVCGGEIVESNPPGHSGPWNEAALWRCVARNDGASNVIHRLPSAANFKNLIGRQLVSVEDNPDSPGIMLFFDNGHVMVFTYDYGAGDIQREFA